MVTRRAVEELLRDALVDSMEPCDPQERFRRLGRVRVLRNKLATMKETVA